MMRLVSWSLLLILAVSMGSGCGKKEGKIAARPPVQVVAMEATLQPVAETLSLVGSVLANEMVEIKAEIDGKVESINFNEGEPVKQGQLLLKLDESKLTNEVAEAQANFALSKATYDRNKQLSQDQLISPQELDQSSALFQSRQALLDLRRRELKDTRIYAPFDGVVGARSVSPGQVIQKNTILTWLVDLEPVKVEINVPEKFVSQLKVGQSIEIGVSAYPNQKFKGEVFFISPNLDTATRTALVKARIPNPEGRLKPGMFANLELTLSIRDRAVVIPEVAINRILEDDRASIFVVDSNKTAQIRMIGVGVRMPGMIEVTKGLQPGEVVVVEGMQKIAPGAKLNLAPASEAQPYRTSGSNTTRMSTNQTALHR